LNQRLVKTDGTYWEIFEKRHYLFYNADDRDRWLDSNWEEYKKVTDSEWLSITKN